MFGWHKGSWNTIWQCMIWMFCLFSLFGLSPISRAEDALCAEVRIEILQRLTIERQAFEAKLKINNGLDSAELENIRINMVFTDENGQSVRASSDPNDTEALFFVRQDHLVNIDAVDGTGTVGTKTNAEIAWLIIPSKGAAANLPEGKTYKVGADLTYRLLGEDKEVVIAPETIRVSPLPNLVLDYFLPLEVYGDDPFTTEAEPIVPFTLGLRIKNTGAGTSYKTRIESAQPVIVENTLGLLIDFAILGSYKDDASQSPSLLMDFGDIAAGKSAVGRWLMTSTLYGRFVEFNASFSHSDHLGGQMTSLIEEIRTHTLVKDVRVTLPGRDGIKDYLADDGDALRVYESDGLDTEVTDHSASAVLNMQGNDRYLLNFDATAGFSYAKVRLNKEFTVGDVIRSDGQTLHPDNIWISKIRKVQNNQSSYEWYLHLFDADSTGIYEVTLTAPMDIGQISGVVFEDLNLNGVQDADEPGIGNVKVSLYGQQISEAYTNPDGSYTFVGLAAGSYHVAVSPVEGYADHLALPGNAGGSSTGNQINDIVMTQGFTATGYSFAKQRSTIVPQQADLAVVWQNLQGQIIGEITPAAEYIDVRLKASRVSGETDPNARVRISVPESASIQLLSGAGRYADGIWQIGELSDTEVATFRIHLIETSRYPLDFSARINGSHHDPVVTNNQATLRVFAPELGFVAEWMALGTDQQLQMQVDELLFNAAGEADIALQITNRTDAVIAQTDALLTLPSGIRIIEATPLWGEFNAETHQWQIVSLPAYTTTHLRLRLAMDEEAQLQINDPTSLLAHIAYGDADDNGSHESNNEEMKSLDLALVLQPFVANQYDLAVQWQNAVGQKLEEITDISAEGVELWLTVNHLGGEPLLNSLVTITGADADNGRLVWLDGSGTFDATTATWLIGEMDAGESVQGHLRWIPETQASATLRMLRASVINDELGFDDIVPTNNLAELRLTPIAEEATEADLAIRWLNAEQAPITTLETDEDGLVQVILDLKHLSGVEVQQAWVELTVPDGLQLVEVQVPGGLYDQASQRWSVGGLQALDQQQAMLKLKMTSAEAVLLQAETGFEREDRIAENNHARLTITRPEKEADADLSVRWLTISGSALSTIETDSQQQARVILDIKHLSGKAVAEAFVDFTLPTGLELISVTSQKGSYQANEQRWKVGAMTAGDHQQAIVLLKMSSNETVSIVAKAGFERDHNTVNNISRLAVKKANPSLPPDGDVQIDWIHENQTVGNQLIFNHTKNQYIVRVTNPGPHSVTPKVYLSWPSLGITVEVKTAEKGTYSRALKRWKVGALKAGESADLIVKVSSITRSQAKLGASMSVSPDSNTKNNNAEFILSKTESPPPSTGLIVLDWILDLLGLRSNQMTIIHEDGTVELGLQISNRATHAETDIQIVLPIENVTWLDSSPSLGKFSLTENVGVWTIDSLDSGASALLKLKLKLIDAEGGLTLSALANGSSLAANATSTETIKPKEAQTIPATSALSLLILSIGLMSAMRYRKHKNSKNG